MLRYRIIARSAMFMGENRYITNAGERGNVNISEEVVAVIAGAAAMEAEGVHGLHISSGRDIVEIAGKKPLSRGIKVHAEDGGVVIDVMLLAKMGHSVSEMGKAVQKCVAEAVEAATGIAVVAVNVHICGISLKRER